jgi:rubrerythrin
MATDNKTIQELDVLERISSLEETLKSTDPQIPVHLANIHKALQTYEELIHLLDDEKIRILMDGMVKYRKVELVKEATTSRGRKSLSKTTEDDI